MAIDFDDFFTRIGKLGYELNLVNSFRGDGGGLLATDLPAEWEDAIETFDGDSHALRQIVQAHVSELPRALRALDGICASIKSTAQAYLVEVVNQDNPQPDRTLKTALVELVRQMEAASKSIESVTPTVAIAYVTELANDDGLMATLQDARLNVREYVLAEDLEVTFPSPSLLTVRGEIPAPGPLHEDYPLGSGSSNNIGINLTGGLVTDGGFELWDDATTLTSWENPIGTLAQEATLIYSESSTLSVKWAGDPGGTLYQVRQVVSVAELQVYAFIGRIRLDDTTSAGVLKIDLWDEDGGEQLIDDALNYLELSVDLTALAADQWHTIEGWFRTGSPFAALPTNTFYLRVRLSTAIDDGVNLYLDDLGLARASQLYAGGPFLAAFGTKSFWYGDERATVTVSHAETNKLGRLCEKLFDLRTHGIQLPSDASPTHADTYIA